MNGRIFFFTGSSPGLRSNTSEPVCCSRPSPQGARELCHRLRNSDYKVASCYIILLWHLIPLKDLTPKQVVEMLRRGETPPGSGCLLGLLRSITSTQISWLAL